jgi:hypothetical protein
MLKTIWISKNHTIGKAKFSIKLNSPAFDTDKSKVIIHPSIKKPKTYIEGSIKNQKDQLKV